MMKDKKKKSSYVKTVATVILIVETAMFAYSVFLMIKADLMQNVYNVVNGVMLAVAMLFGIIIIASQASERNAFENKAIFTALAAVQYLMTFISVLILVKTGVYGSKATQTVLLSMYYFATVTYWGVFWLYLRKSTSSAIKETMLDVLVAAMLLAYCVVIITNIYTGTIFTVDDHGNINYNNGTDLVSNLWMLGIMAFYTIYIFTRKTFMRTKISLMSYIFFPLVYLVGNLVISDMRVHLLLADSSDIINLLGLYVIFINVYISRGNDVVKQKAENTEMQTAIAISQIQPHFVYNTLATISALSLSENAPRTNEVVNKFSSYLRVNLDSFDSNALVPFEKELEHVKTYLFIEKVRFGEDLEVVYDIGFTDFMIPTLSLQPLVENAVKYGVCSRELGGTVTISAKKENDHVFVSVADDGIGFDTTEEKADGKNHIGIKNVRSRVESLCGGTVTVRSRKGEGTVATIILMLADGGKNSER